MRYFAFLWRSTKFSCRHFIHILCGKIILLGILKILLSLFSKVSSFIFNLRLSFLYHENVFRLHVTSWNRNGIKHISTWIMKKFRCRIQRVHQWIVSRVRWNPVQDTDLHLLTIHCNVSLVITPRDMRWRSATSRKVADPFADGVTGIFL